MEKEKLEQLFDDLQGSFDIASPEEGHQDRFLAKLNSSKGVVALPKRKKSWWKPVSIAASAAILLALGIGLFTKGLSVAEQVAEISPEVSQSQFYFANLVAEQVRTLENESTPETKQIVDDTMKQLKRLEADYTQLEQNLLEGGNSKLLLSAMITNFQTRIDLLQDVLNRIETIKNLKNYDDENYTL